LKYCFPISDVPADSLNADVLGGKGYGLVHMAAKGYPVPPAYVITTEACREYLKGGITAEDLMQSIRVKYIPEIIKGLTAHFGYLPLVSVRSGAKFSMPGMMSTILNVGLDLSNEGEWSARIGIEATEDSRKRLIEMYGEVVRGMPRSAFEGLSLPQREKCYEVANGHKFPVAEEQLLASIEAVFKSWNNDRAKSYRYLNGIPHDLGTAVVIQAMVFGNMNDKSATGVLFTRDPSSGAHEITGEFLINAQGEDVVAGIRTPEPLPKLDAWNGTVAKELYAMAWKLEKEAGDAQDIEFTVQDGKLFFLQTRSMKRTAQAAIKIAMDLYDEKLIGAETVMERVTHKQFLAATRPSIDPEWKKTHPAHGKGIAASSGVAVGKAVFSSATALVFKKNHPTEQCILIAEETTPDDIDGMNAAVGILTRTGGSTSHAAVVARGMDKVCVVVCGALERKGNSWFIMSDDSSTVHIVHEGQPLAIDGTTGEVWFGGEPPLVNGAERPEVKALLDLIEDTYDTYRVVTKPSQVKGQDKVLLLAAYTCNIAAFEACVKAFKGSHMVIDLRPKFSMVPDADKEFVMAFGADGLSTADAGFMKEHANVLVKYGDSKCMIVIGMKVSGFKEIPTVTSLEDLLSVKGLCMPDSVLLQKTVGVMNVKRIVDLRRKAGDDLQSFNVLSTKTDPKLLQKVTIALSRDALILSALA